MKNMLDKNGNPLKGGARWLRIISNDGGLEKHDNRIAMEAFAAFLESRPEISTSIAESEIEARRRAFKRVK